MTLKGKIQSNHIPVNNYELQVVGLPTLVLTEVAGIEQEIDAVDLPDRTRASGGNAQSISFDIVQPSHHDTEVAAMEAWHLSSKDPVAGDYKKTANLIKKNIGGEVIRIYTITGLWPMRRGLPDLAMANAGDMDTVTWGMSADDVIVTQ